MAAAGFYFQFGNYKHAVAETEIDFQRRAVASDTGEIIYVTTSIDIQGTLIAATQTALHKAIGQLQDAYATGGKDAILRFPNGSATHIKLLTADCLGGVRVTMPPSFPSNRDGSYTTWINYRLQLEGDVFVEATENTIAFSETTVFSGGGPEYGHLRPLNAPPIKVMLRSHSVFRCVQSGQAEGLLYRPTMPAPLFPDALMKAPEQRLTSPKRRGFGDDLTLMRFQTAWTYEFESASPLIGRPHSWTV